MQKLIIATRSSPLAMWQARHVAQLLEAAGMPSALRPVETIGDKRLEVTLSKVGDKGVFTQELEHMLLQGDAHLAVHSAKDMPSKIPQGLELLAFTQREQAEDVLVSHLKTLDLSTPGLVVGTSSTRRVAILKRYYPQIETVSVRGNLQTRIRKMEEGACHALLLAYAGIARMGFGGLIRQTLSADVFTPAVGQGALAIEVASSLSQLWKDRIKTALHHQQTGLALQAERSFLREMDGGCSVPVFGYAQVGEGRIDLHGGIVSLDGRQEIRHTAWIAIEDVNNESVERLGSTVAQAILAAGGDVILSEIKQNLRP